MLLSRVDALARQIGNVYDALSHRRLSTTQLERVAVTLGNILEAQRKRVTQLREEIEGNDADIESSWNELTDIHYTIAPVFRECLRLIEGAAVRQLGLDGEICDLADALLREVNKRAELHWDRFTVLDEGEYFYDMAQIIRLRFPDTSIWSLPIAAHEFGHFAELELRTRVGQDTRFPVRELVQEAGSRETAIAQEQFADVFATYALGPAFAYTCVRSRFDPVRSSWSSDRHPSANVRVHGILRMLARMDGSNVIPMYAQVIAYLMESWATGVRAAGGDPELPSTERKTVDEYTDRCLELLQTRAPALRYDGWPRALMAQAAVDERDSDVPNGTSIADVLNAAWLARQAAADGADAVREIGERAVRHCRKIMRH